MNRLIPTALLAVLIISCYFKSREVSSDSLNTDGYLYTYKSEPYTGKVIDTTKAGRVLLSFSCENGRIEGDYFEYHENGYLSFQVKYIKGLKEGKATSYYLNGKIFKIETYLGNQLTGPYKEYYNNGNLKVSGNFLNWKRDGLWEEFYENGTRKSKGTYSNDHQIGYWEYYYSTGNIHICGNFEDGDGSNLGTSGVPLNGRTGSWKYYSEDENYLDFEVEFKHGEPNGPFKKYFKNGSIQAQGNYKNGELHGIYEEFDEKGKLVDTKEFSHGIEVEKNWLFDKS